MAADLLRLQRLAGNDAVVQLLRPAAAPLVLQRYEAGEHLLFGGEPGKQRSYTVNGVTLTYGEMIAMGDFFESPREMQEAPAAVLPELKKAINDDIAKPGSVTTERWEQATAGLPKGKRYTDMASKNAAHFAPASGPRQPGAPKDHQAMWRMLHFQALNLALAGKTDEAMETNAFADHFLTDAFSAGHLINKADTMARAKASMKAAGTPGVHIVDRSVFTDKVATGILKNAPELQNYQIRVKDSATFWWNKMNHESLTEIIYGSSQEAETQEGFFSLFVRLAHDSLNQDIHKDPSGAIVGGVEVENGKGDHWMLSGDETLALSPETLRIGREAVAQSQRNIISAMAHRGTGTLDYEGLAALVWEYVPHPTATPAGKGKVDQAVGTFTDVNQQQTIDRFVDVSVSNLPTLIAKLTEKHLMRPKPGAQPAPSAPRPLPVPAAAR